VMLKSDNVDEKVLSIANLHSLNPSKSTNDGNIVIDNDRSIEVVNVNGKSEDCKNSDDF
jgi:hypothetical protein